MPYRDKKNWNRWNKNRYDRNKVVMLELKSKPCTDCGRTYPHYVMEFDHVPGRGKKKRGISELSGSRKITAPGVVKELKKCDLVCANCHRVRSHERGQQSQGHKIRQYYKNKKIKDESNS